MATRVSENTEVESHYVTQVALTTALLAALRRLWPTVNPMSGPEAAGRYRDGVVAVVDQFALASASLSVDYYEAMRENAGISTPLRVQLIDPPPRELIDAGVDWAMSAQAEMAEIEAAIQARVEAAMQKAVADSGRGQVVAAVEGDELALGFARVARPDGCYWCISQAIRRTGDGRLGVYKSRATAGQIPPNEKGEVNRFHNNCQCQVVPVFDNGFELAPELAELEELYGEATENSKVGERLNDFRKALEAMRNGKSAPLAQPTRPAVSGADRLAALQNILDGFGN